MSPSCLTGFKVPKNVKPPAARGYQMEIEEGHTCITGTSSHAPVKLLKEHSLFTMTARRPNLPIFSYSADSKFLINQNKKYYNSY